MPRRDLTAKILMFARNNPRATNGEIARAVQCSHQNVSQTLDRYAVSQRGTIIDLDATVAPENIAWLRRESARQNVRVSEILNAVITDARLDAEEVDA